MKITIAVKDRMEADAVAAAWADPTTRALVITCGVLLLLPTDRARRRVLAYVADKLAEYTNRRHGGAAAMKRAAERAARAAMRAERAAERARNTVDKLARWIVRAPAGGRVPPLRRAGRAGQIRGRDDRAAMGAAVGGGAADTPQGYAMKRGRKPIPDKLRVVRGGRFRKERVRVPVVPPVPGEPGACPAWLRGVGRKLWHVKLAIYAAREQSVVGCEGALAQYCAIEADLARRWRIGLDVPASMLNAYRIFCSEFFDTPASQIGQAAKPAAANRFAGHAAG